MAHENKAYSITGASLPENSKQVVAIAQRILVGFRVPAVESDDYACMPMFDCHGQRPRLICRRTRLRYLAGSLHGPPLPPSRHICCHIPRFHRFSSAWHRPTATSQIFAASRPRSAAQIGSYQGPDDPDEDGFGALSNGKGQSRFFKRIRE